MTKVIEMTPIGLAHTPNMIVWQSFINDMSTKNAYIPKIDRVIFNLKTTETVAQKDADGKPIVDAKGRVKREVVACKPVLATIVYFRDGTKVSVVNSDADVVKTEQKEITYTDLAKDGKEVLVKSGKFATVATEAAKEAGLVYAIVKRLVGAVDEKTGNVSGNGFGRQLKEVVAKAYDTQYKKVWGDVFKDLCRKEHEERQAAAKARKAKRTPTIEENIATLVKQNADLLAKLNPGA